MRPAHQGQGEQAGLSGERRELAGVLLAVFYGDEVRSFREYWHRRVL